MIDVLVRNTKPSGKIFRRFAGLNRFAGELFLLIDIEFAHKQRRIADILTRLVFLLLQNLKDMRVTLNLCITRANHHETDIRLFALPVTINASVTLLEHHQRPRGVEMDEPVAQIVQVQAFGSHVGGHENTYRR